MTNRSAAYLAELLLSKAGRDRDQPHYGERSFQRKVRRANERDRRQPMPTFDAPYDYLLREEWTAVVRLANLTACQRAVLILRLGGLTFEEIGRQRGHTKQGARNILDQAMVKIERAQDAYAYTGLASAYREDTRRRGRA